MMRVPRGSRRKSNPDIFLSHSSKDKKTARRLATDLNFCGVDVWLDAWELEIGCDLPEEIAKAMDTSHYIGILITENYNTTVWTKTEYKKALSREQKEGRIVMLPIIVGEAPLPSSIEQKVYIDLREDYYPGLARIAGMVHGLTEMRVRNAIEDMPPRSVRDIWALFDSIGFDPFVVFGDDDFDEMLKYGGKKIRDDYAYFDPDSLLQSDHVSEHVKKLLREGFY